MIDKKLNSNDVAELDRYFSPKSYVVEKLPNEKDARDGTEVFKKNSSGAYDVYKMIKGEWIVTNSNLNTVEKVIITGSGGSGTAGVDSFNGRNGAVTPQSGDYSNSDVGLGNVDNVQQMPLSYLDIDDTLAADSDTKVPSQQATKAYVDNNLADNNTVIVKEATETQNTNTTLTDDAELVFTTEASTKYLIELFVSYNIHATPDIKFAFAHAGTTTSWLANQIMVNNDDGLTMNFNDATLTTVTTITSGSNIDGVLKINAILEVGGSGGAFSLQWAQNTSDANNITVYKGSYLKYKKI